RCHRDHARRVRGALLRHGDAACAQARRASGRRAVTSAIGGTAAVDAARVRLLSGPTPVEPMDRLRAALGAGPRLLVKRDDAIPFGFGGNKIRKLEFVLA